MVERRQWKPLMPCDSEVQGVWRAQAAMPLHQNPGILEPRPRNLKNNAAHCPTVERQFGSLALPIGQRPKPHMM